MAQVQITLSDLQELVSVEKQDAIDTLTMLGFPTEEMDGGQLNVEVTPNRPDALCVEGIARALRCYLEGKPAIYKAERGSVEATKDASVQEVRPAFGCAVVRGVKMSDSLLRSLMQVQEKLHETLGRKRRKMAIGIYDLGTVKPPFRYFACGREEISFVPLGKSEKMTPLEILARHEKGMAYAHLVGEKCPMIVDTNGEVLSFPPIINSEGTRVTETTTGLFMEATGSSEEAVRSAMNILAAMLADRGGKIEEVLIGGKLYKLLEEKKWPLPVKESERLLGVKLTGQQVSELLQKMGYRTEGECAFAPGYRVDVMSEVDLVEDVAIAYGFNNFEPRLPSASTVGRASPESPFHEIMVGLGFDEAITWLLSNPEHEATAGVEAGQRVEIENPLTAEFSSFRVAILPGLLSVLAESRNEKLPIKLYEIGPVARPHLEERLALVSMHPRASFSEIKGLVLSMAENSGRKAEVKAGHSGQFVEGRCAELFLDGKPAGFFGEISPKVLAAFGLEQPVCAAEIRI